MKGIKRTLTAGIVAGFVTLAPTLALASGESYSTNTGFHALSTLDQSDLMTLDAMSENELESTKGENFNRGNRRNFENRGNRGNWRNRGNRGNRGNQGNFATVTQVNICYYCTNVTQINSSTIIQANN